MIKAQKSRWIQWGFAKFNKRFLHYHFYKIHFMADESFLPNKRTIYVINHSTWWDPLMIHYLNDQVIGSDCYGMMHEDGLKRFPFFKKIGAYSVDSKDRRHLIESLQYSIELLELDKTIWIFPQGEEQHLEKRPLQFMNGAAYIIEKCPDVTVVPVSIYYSFEHTRKPNVYIKAGSPLDKSVPMNRKELTSYMEEVSTRQLDALKKMVIEENHTSFSVLNR